jgi:hypothetical protein
MPVNITTDLYSAWFVNSNTGFAVGQNGVVLKTTSSGIGIKKISTEIPDRFSLSQNYPNPFNPATNLRFEVTETGIVTLKIYDVLGREVTTLVNEQLEPGTYEVYWDASVYNGGVYFYSLASENYSQARKMILLK